MAKAPSAATRSAIKSDAASLKADLQTAGREGLDELRDLASRTESTVRERAAEARERAREYYDQARSRGREYYDDAQERMDEYQRLLSERVQEKPLQSTAIAVGVGVVLGLLLAGRRR